MKLFLFLCVLLFGVVRMAKLKDEPDGVTEEMEYLKRIYRTDTGKGCGTEIKCDIPDSFTSNSLLSNSTNEFLGNSTYGGYNCCYDCANSCIKDRRCYQSWQCCGSSETNGDETSKSFAYFDDFTSCEQTLIHNVYNDPTWKPFERMDVSYYMVSNCPDQFEDLETKIKCSSNSSIYSLIERIPFISRKMHMVFKNIHCARCHYVLVQDLIPFSLSVHEWIGHSDFEISFISRFETVSDIFSINMSSIYPVSTNIDRVLITALPEHLETNFHFSPIPCYKRPFDITPIAIGLDTTKEMNDLQLRACNIFDFPLTVFNYVALYTFKNLACALIKFPGLTINHAPIYQFYKGGPIQACALDDTPGPRNIVNLRPVMSETFTRITTNNRVVNNISRGRSILAVEDPNPSGRVACSIGFFLDTFQNRCRKILCPHRFYIYKSKCEPVYLQTVRVPYFTMVKITPTLRHTRISYIKNLMPLVVDIITRLTDLNVCGYETHFKPASNGKVEYAILSLYLTAKSDVLRYIDILGRIRHIYEDTLYHKYDKSGVLSNLNFGPAGNVYTEPSWVRRTMYDTNDDMTLNIIPKLKFELFIPSRHCSNRLPISKLAYCNRVKLAPSEFSFLYNSVGETYKITIKVSGKIIYNNHYEILEDGHIRMCISDYMGTSKFHPTLSTNVVGKDEDFIDLYINISLGIIAIIIIAAIIYCRFKRDVDIQ